MFEGQGGGGEAVWCDFGLGADYLRFKVSTSAKEATCARQNRDPLFGKTSQKLRS